MLPSISNLLNEDDNTYININDHQAPRLYVVPPPSPRTPPLLAVINDNNSSCPSPMLSPSCLLPSFPPSPIDSVLPPLFDVAGSDDDDNHHHRLPPLQGYDPPACHKPSTLPEAAPWSVKDTHNTTLQSQQQQQHSLQQPLFSPSTGQPIFKRRRGRPRSSSIQSLYYNNRDTPLGSSFGESAGGLTFLTPTIWDVPASDPGSKSPADFEVESRAPRKKRGRKPKVNLEGHSCFVLPSSLQQKLKKV